MISFPFFILISAAMCTGNISKPDAKHRQESADTKGNKNKTKHNAPPQEALLLLFSAMAVIVCN